MFFPFSNLRLSRNLKRIRWTSTVCNCLSFSYIFKLDWHVYTGHICHISETCSVKHSYLWINLNIFSNTRSLLNNIFSISNRSSHFWYEMLLYDVRGLANSPLYQFYRRDHLVVVQCTCRKTKIRLLCITNSQWIASYSTNAYDTGLKALVSSGNYDISLDFLIILLGHNACHNCYHFGRCNLVSFNSFYGIDPLWLVLQSRAVYGKY